MTSWEADQLRPDAHGVSRSALPRWNSRAHGSLRERSDAEAKRGLARRGRWAAAASHKTLGELARLGREVSLRLFDAPTVCVTVRVERVSRGRSTVITGHVTDASPAAYDLQYDLTRTFRSYFSELAPPPSVSGEQPIRARGSES